MQDSAGPWHPKYDYIIHTCLSRTWCEYIADDDGEADDDDDDAGECDGDDDDGDNANMMTQDDGDDDHDDDADHVVVCLDMGADCWWLVGSTLCKEANTKIRPDAALMFRIFL